VNLEELRDRRGRERQQDSLQRLPESFYRDVGEYLADLKRERDAVAEEAADPYGDPKVRRLTDELQSAQSLVESLYERRVGKVVKHASFAAADMPHDSEGLTDEERALFDDLVGRIKENRGRVLDPLNGEGTPDEGEDDGAEAERAPPRTEPASGRRTVEDGPSAADAPAEPTPPETSAGPGEATTASDPADAGSGAPADHAGMLAEAMGASPSAGDDAPSEDDAPADHEPPAEDDAPADDRTTVRITADVGEIYGVDDRSYRLAAEDVVDLPADNARPLVEKDAAEEL
jgi:DNA replication factor GINS